MGPRFESVRADQNSPLGTTLKIRDAGKRPVGQVVKTVASHAINIGSNPVRVTSSSQAAYPSLPSKHESSLIALLITSARDRFAGLFAGRECKNSA